MCREVSTSSLRSLRFWGGDLVSKRKESWEDLRLSPLIKWFKESMSEGIETWERVVRVEGVILRVKKEFNKGLSLVKDCESESLCSLFY